MGSVRILAASQGKDESAERDCYSSCSEHLAIEVSKKLDSRNRKFAKVAVVCHENIDAGFCSRRQMNSICLTYLVRASNDAVAVRRCLGKRKNFDRPAEKVLLHCVGTGDRAPSARSSQDFADGKYACTQGISPTHDSIEDIVNLRAEDRVPFQHVDKQHRVPVNPGHSWFSFRAFSSC